MPHRRFTDAEQVLWEVWDVHPHDIHRHMQADQSQGQTPNTPPRTTLGGELSNGWLCFESSDTKRRLSPIPRAWETMTDEQLADLCAQARNAPLGRVRRLEQPPTVE